jgi:hypothetical protein
MIKGVSIMSEDAVNICRKCGGKIDYDHSDDSFLHFRCQQKIELELERAKTEHEWKLKQIRMDEENEERNLPKKRY